MSITSDRDKEPQSGIVTRSLTNHVHQQIEDMMRAEQGVQNYINSVDSIVAELLGMGMVSYEIPLGNGMAIVYPMFKDGHPEIKKNLVRFCFYEGNLIKETRPHRWFSRRQNKKDARETYMMITPGGFIEFNIKCPVDGRKVEVLAKEGQTISIGYGVPRTFRVSKIDALKEVHILLYTDRGGDTALPEMNIHI